MRSHRARIICFQLTILISFIFLTQAVSAKDQVTHLIDVVDVVDKQENKTNIAIIDPRNPTSDLNVVKDELFDLKGIRLLPDTKVFFYNVDQGTLYSPEVIDERDKIYFIFIETELKDQPPRYEVSVKYLEPLPTETARVHGKIPKGVLKLPLFIITAFEKKGIEEPKRSTYVTLMPVEESLEGRGKYHATFELFALKRSESDKEDKKESLKKFTFPIHEIYHFNIRLGFIYSTLKNPEYGVRDIFTPDSSQKQRVLVITSEGDTQFDPALSVVYYPKGNDLRLDPNRKELKERFHWVVGFPLRRVFESFFVGINYELSIGVDIIAGVRTGKVKKLISDMVPYEPGTTGYTILPQEFTNDDIPLKEKWDYSYFLGIVFDTAVFTRLFGFD